MNINAEKAGRLRDAIKEKGAAIAADHVALAELLYEVRNSFIESKGELTPLWMYWRFSSWEDYVEHDTKFHWGWANAHIRMYENIVLKCEVNITPALMKQCGITNLLEVAKIVTPTTKDTCLRKAKEMSCCELKHWVMNHRAGRRGYPFKDPKTIARIVEGSTKKQFIKACRILEELLDGVPNDAIKVMAKDAIEKYGPQLQQAKARAVA